MLEFTKILWFYYGFFREEAFIIYRFPPAIMFPAAESASVRLLSQSMILKNLRWMDFSQRNYRSGRVKLSIVLKEKIRPSRS